MITMCCGVHWVALCCCTYVNCCCIVNVFPPFSFPLFFSLHFWSLGEGGRGGCRSSSRVFSLSIKLVCVIVSSPSIVLLTNNTHSSLSVFPSVGIFSSFAISIWRQAKLSSILWISSVLVYIAAESWEGPASFLLPTMLIFVC